MLAKLKPIFATSMTEIAWLARWTNDLRMYEQAQSYDHFNNNNPCWL